MTDAHDTAFNAQYLHPVWVRAWHWLNALLFLALIVTGFSMHFSGAAGQVVSFSVARVVHNVAGWLVVANYVAYVVGLVMSGQWRQYLSFPPDFPRTMVKQARFYAGGIFRGEAHPEHPTPERKFNALQQITYLKIVAFAIPAVIVTGAMLHFPELAPKEILGAGGVWPIAVLHTVIAYLLVAFTIGHVYLTTTGETPEANVRAMLSGWHRRAHISDEQVPLDSARTPSRQSDDTPSGAIADEGAST